MLVHRGRRDIGPVAERLWYPIWDENLALDHSVRTVKEALSVADRDLRAAVGLLDARRVAGDPELAEELVRRAGEQWRKRARRWLPALDKEVTDRHRRMGEVAFLLEPELKESKGGLRDLNALRAIAAAVPILPDEDLVAPPAHDVLFAARVELHRRSGRSLDRLLLETQDDVAADLGLVDADELMARIAAAGRTIAWAGDDARRRVRSWLEGPKGRGAGADRPLGPGLVLREGEVELSADATPADDPSLVLRAAAAAAYAGALLSRAAMRRFVAEAPAPASPWPDEARQALVGLLGAGESAIPVIETLDQHGIVVRLLPEWEHVRSRPQRNAYHRFTVDRHLIEAAAQAAAFTRQVARPDLLLVAALLHDLGKGYPGDHTDVGVELTERIATRMGFPPADVDVLVALVRHHLLLPMVATRRDLDDPATVAAVVDAVGDLGTLELLEMLTEADSLATGEAAWSPWKAELIHELVSRVARRLAGHEPPEPPEPAEPPVALAARAADGLLVEVEGSRLTVVAPDRPGLFCQIVGLLTVHGQDVRAARAGSTEDGLAVDTFEVEPAVGGSLDPARLEADLVEALAGRHPLDDRVAERARTYATRQRPGAARPAEPRVIVHNDASATATVVEVRAPDGIGVLYRITRALARHHLDIRHAKVATLGHEVVDSFYVRDVDGQKLVDPELLAQLEHAILAELSEAS